MAAGARIEAPLFGQLHDPAASTANPARPAWSASASAEAGWTVQRVQRYLHAGGYSVWSITHFMAAHLAVVPPHRSRFSTFSSVTHCQIIDHYNPHLNV